MTSTVDSVPKFDENGNLPPGIYRVSPAEIERRFDWNPRRRRLYAGLQQALANLTAAGIRKVWIDGSFVTAKAEPNDVDGCWEYESSMDVEKLDQAFLDTSPPRKAMKEKYGIDFLIAGTPLGDPQARGRTVQEFFQRDRDGNPKGILLVEIGG